MVGIKVSLSKGVILALAHYQRIKSRTIIFLQLPK